MSEHDDEAVAETLASTSGQAVAQTLIGPAAQVGAGDFAALQTVNPANYELGKELARGGMGRIRHARDRRLRRPLAVKELIASDPALARRFEREVLITARLQHPSIVSIYEAGRWPDGTPFYAMRHRFRRMAGPRDQCVGGLAEMIAVA